MQVYYAKTVKLNLRAVEHCHASLASGAIKWMKEILFSVCGHVHQAIIFQEILAQKLRLKLVINVLQDIIVKVVT